MTDDTVDPSAVDPSAVDQSTVQSADSDDPRLAVLQAVVDRVISWQEGADEPTVRKELDDAIAESDIEVDEATREKIVRHVLEDTSHGDIRHLLS
jgi:hypothetical protein